MIPTRRHAFRCVLILLAGCSGGPEQERPEAQGTFRFEWNTLLDDPTLGELVARDEERYREEPRITVLRDAAFRIEQAYRLEGYHRVRAIIDAAGTGPVFIVEEGPRYGLGRVHFEGNRFIPDRALKQLKPDELPGTTLPFSERLIARLQADLQRIYNDQGFVEAEVGVPEWSVDEERLEIHVTIPITEGRSYHVEAIVGVPRDEDLEGELADEIGVPFTSGSARQVEATILDYYRDRGYPFVQVRVDADPDWETGAVTLRATVVPGREATIRGFAFKGNERTRDSYIRRRSGLSETDPVRASDLRQAEDQLQKTGLFKTVRVEAAEFDEEAQLEEGNLTLRFTLEEADPGEVSVSAGFSTLDGLRVGTEARYMNLLGGAEMLRVGGSVSQFGWRAEADAALRFLMGTDFTPGAGGFYEDRDEPSFEAVTYGGSLALSYPILEDLDVTGGVRFAEVETGEVDASVPAGDVLDFQYTALFLSASFDMRDNPFLPTEGFYVLGEVEWSDEKLHSDIEFVNVRGQGAVYVPLLFETVWATGMQGGQILPLDTTDTIPISLRQFAGGTGTVRGFEFRSLGPGGPDDPTGGEVFLSLQTELRFPVWGILHGAIFHDRGGVWFRHEDVDLDETRWSVGSGLRVYTPAGALTADVAWNPSREDDEEAVVFHFSIGFPF